MCKFAFCGIFSILIFNVYSEEKLKVSIYIESICPDALSFIAKQFYPAYQRLAPHLDIDIIPYGKANHSYINGVWNFQCQHGNDECYGNRVQACALAQNYNLEMVMSWFSCVANEPEDPLLYMSLCADRMRLNWEILKKCAEETEQGYELLAKMGDRTHSLVPGITHIPTILFKGVYDEKLQVPAQKDFLRTACDLMTSKPVACLET